MSSLKNNFKGWLGEKMTAFGMVLSLDKSIYKRFHNLIINAPDGTTQIDHVVVSPYGIFVLETKNMKGWIFGSERDANWTQSLYNKKNSFQNPLRQNYRHTKCLAEFLELSHEFMHSIVFFIGECKLKSRVPENVMTSGVADYIKGFHKVILSDHQISEVEKKISILKNDSSLTNKNHIESLKQRHSDQNDVLASEPNQEVVKVADKEVPRIYVFLNNKVLGPYADEEIFSLLDDSFIREETQVCVEGSQDWITFKAYLNYIAK